MIDIQGFCDTEAVFNIFMTLFGSERGLMWGFNMFEAASDI